MKNATVSYVLGLCVLLCLGLLLGSCAVQDKEVIQEQETCTCQRATQKIVTKGEPIQ